MDMGRELGWDDGEVVDDGGFEVLPEGVYAFEVAKLTKERFEGSDKIGPCPRAALELSVVTPNGVSKVFDRILLSTKVQWRVAKFFEGLGYPKDPETGKVRVAWNEVEGRQGYVEIGVRTWVGKEGRERKGNEVVRYLPPSEWPEDGGMSAANAPQAQPVQTAMPMPAQPAQQASYARPDGYAQGGAGSTQAFTPGSF